ncbi:MAG: aminoacyl-tRNA hydrolase [Clostridia bacterium]|nr:aminoacyl-tRNA hydrolase [Clostridia bacterium]
MSNIFDLFKKIESASPLPITHAVVGLGNPGKEYEGTRHNVGFEAIDHIAAASSTRIDRAKFHALVGEATLGGKRVLLIKPQTFMNLSGTAVSEALAFYKLPPENLLVLCDDVSFDPGLFRIRRKGTHGGHNGLRNIISSIGSEDFARIKIGVGKKPRPEYDLADWVLSRPAPADRDAIIARHADMKEAVCLWLNGCIDEAMNRYSK